VQSHSFLLISDARQSHLSTWHLSLRRVATLFLRDRESSQSCDYISSLSSNGRFRKIRHKINRDEMSAERQWNTHNVATRYISLFNCKLAIFLTRYVSVIIYYAWCSCERLAAVVGSRSLLSFRGNASLPTHHKSLRNLDGPPIIARGSCNKLRFARVFHAHCITLFYIYIYINIFYIYI